MIDINMIEQIVHSIFQGSGGTMSKQGILSKLMQIPNGKTALPVFQQLPDRNDYTEQSAAQEARNIAQKQGAGGIAGKIKSKIGV